MSAIDRVPVFAAALWWGGLTAIGFIAVPVLFSSMATPAMAGQTAAKLFAERGYRAVTIDDIGASLDYTKSVVYYYFTSKNDILWQIFQRIYDSYFAGVSEILARNLPPAEAMAAIIRNSGSVSTSSAP